MPTGAGAWEKAAQLDKARKDGSMKFDPNTKLRTKTSKAFPTKCHMSMVELMEKGLLKHIISQNCDGLHRRSGVPAEKISEVHGNSNKEVCLKCEREYMRDFPVRNARGVKEHLTGRKCDDPKCRGNLKDTIINFGENLDDTILATG